jgi:hypothetical protein
MYNCENDCTIEKIFSELDSNETPSITFLKQLFFFNPSGNLASVTSNFVVISKKKCPPGGRQSGDE